MVLLLLQEVDQRIGEGGEKEVAASVLMVVVVVTSSDMPHEGQRW